MFPTFRAAVTTTGAPLSNWRAALMTLVRLAATLRCKIVDLVRPLDEHASATLTRSAANGSLGTLATRPCHAGGRGFDL
jgi:hypothetical protein